MLCSLTAALLLVLSRCIVARPDSVINFLRVSDPQALQTYLESRSDTSQNLSVRQLSANHEMAKRKSAYMRFGRSALQRFDEEMGKPTKRKSYYMRFGKRSDAKAQYSVYEASAAEPVQSGSATDSIKLAYMRLGKRSGLISSGALSDAAIAATLNRNLARMRFGRR